MAIVAANDVGKSAILFYLLSYAVTNLAAFAVIALLGTRDHANDDLASYAGLSNRHPVLAAAMTVFLLSLGGLPADGGVRREVVRLQRGRSLGVLRAGDRRRPDERGVDLLLPARRRHDVHGGAGRRASPRRPRPARAAVVALALSVIAIFYLGVLPTQVLDLAARSIATIF